MFLFILIEVIQELNQKKDSEIQDLKSENDSPKQILCYVEKEEWC